MGSPMSYPIHSMSWNANAAAAHNMMPAILIVFLNTAAAACFVSGVMILCFFFVPERHGEGCAPRDGTPSGEFL